MASSITKPERILTQRRKDARVRIIKSLFFFPIFASLHLGVFALIFSFSVSGQRVAFLTPDKAEKSRELAQKLDDRLNEKFHILDDSMSEAAYLSAAPATPFNLTTDEAKRIGLTIGCDAYILLRAATQRRSAFQRAEYYESYAAIYVVSTRTGQLILWRLQRFEDVKPARAEKKLNDSVKALAAEIADQISAAMKAEMTEPRPADLEEAPDPGAPAEKGFRAPIPYRRIKPEYTVDANLYDIAATVDLVVDLDEKGSIMRTEIVRWAGFGLDQSVERTVRSMNWRPAERNGKALPMRFLVRYNFKRIEKE